MDKHYLQPLLEPEVIVVFAAPRGRRPNSRPRRAVR